MNIQKNPTITKSEINYRPILPEFLKLYLDIWVDIAQVIVLMPDSNKIDPS